MGQKNLKRNAGQFSKFGKQFQYTDPESSVDKYKENYMQTQYSQTAENKKS